VILLYVLEYVALAVIVVLVVAGVWRVWKKWTAPSPVEELEKAYEEVGKAKGTAVKVAEVAKDKQRHALELEEAAVRLQETVGNPNKKEKE